MDRFRPVAEVDATVVFERHPGLSAAYPADCQSPCLRNSRTFRRSYRCFWDFRGRSSTARKGCLLSRSVSERRSVFLVMACHSFVLTIEAEVALQPLDPWRTAPDREGSSGEQPFPGMHVPKKKRSVNRWLRRDACEGASGVCCHECRPAALSGRSQIAA